MWIPQQRLCRSRAFLYDAAVARYYRNQHLKNALLQSIENIEMALNARTAYVLGKHTQVFGYLKFANRYNHIWMKLIKSSQSFTTDFST